MIWRPIPSCPGYEASSDGLIRSFKRGTARLKKPHADKEGYLMFMNHQDGAVKRKAVHTAVAEAFYGLRPEGMIVRHLDGDQKNNTASNLRYGSHSENAADAVRHGTNSRTQRTECPQAHLYDSENTYFFRGHRHCRQCNRAAARRSKERRMMRAAGVPVDSVAVSA